MYHTLYLTIDNNFSCLERLGLINRVVINLHKLKTKLDKMLVRDKRVEIAKKCFEFLETQVELDLKGFEEDIFSH